MQIYMILSLIVAGIAILFAVQNAGMIEINFLVWSFEGSLALVLLIALALGVVISLLASAPSVIRRNLTIRSQKIRINELETNLAAQQDKLTAAQAQIDELKQPKLTDEAQPESSLPEQIKT